MNEFRSRILAPFAVPVLVLIGGAVFVFAYSRVLLAVPKYWSVALAFLLAAEILGIAAVVSLVRRVSGFQRLMIGALGAMVLVGGGIGLASGIRPIEGHHAGIPIAAKGLAFDVAELTVPADEPFTIEFTNDDANIPHNVAIYGDDTFSEGLFVGEIFPGVATKVYDVPAVAAGDYAFRCDVHPQMNGSVIAVGAAGEHTASGEHA